MVGGTGFGGFNIPVHDYNVMGRQDAFRFADFDDKGVQEELMCAPPTSTPADEYGNDKSKFGELSLPVETRLLPPFGWPLGTNSTTVRRALEPLCLCPRIVMMPQLQWMRRTGEDKGNNDDDDVNGDAAIVKAPSLTKSAKNDDGNDDSKHDGDIGVKLDPKTAATAASEQNLGASGLVNDNDSKAKGELSLFAVGNEAEGKGTGTAAIIEDPTLATLTRNMDDGG